jgi:hypothetical protein
LFLALQKRGCRHGPGHAEAKGRKKTWNALLKLVFEDRKNNEESTHAQRINDLYPNGMPDDDDGDQGNEDDFGPTMCLR